MAKKAEPKQNPADDSGDETARDIVVFITSGQHAVCRDCGCKIEKGSFLRSEDRQPYCMSCADLGHLVYLPRGDAALTAAGAQAFDAVSRRGQIQSRAAAQRAPGPLGRGSRAGAGRA